MIGPGMRVLCLCVAMALLQGCSDSSDSLSTDGTAEKPLAIVAAEAAALKVLDIHLEARNKLDADLIAAANNYPNVRIFTGNLQVFDTREQYSEFEDLIVMPAQAASEWDHSVWDEIRIIQSSEDKVHLAVNWSRVNGDGDKFLARPQFYFVTRFQGNWGILARSPLQDVDLLVHESSRIDPGAENAAIDVLRKYFDARNKRDSEAIAALNHYPLLLLDGADLQIFDTAQDYLSYEENTVMHGLDYAEWDHSELRKFDVVQSAPGKVHLTYSCEHVDVVSECISIEEGLWVITKVGDRWGILGRSML